MIGVGMHKWVLAGWLTLGIIIGSYAMNQESMSKTVVKVTYWGPQNKTVPSLIIKPKGIEVPIQKFKDLNLYFANDDALSQTLSVDGQTMTKLEKLLTDVIAETNDPGVDPVLTLVMLNIGSDANGRANLSKSRAIEIMARIHQMIADETEARQALEIWLTRTDLKRK
jgi:hypothetical protein